MHKITKLQRRFGDGGGAAAGDGSGALAFGNVANAAMGITDMFMPLIEQKGLEKAQKKRDKSFTDAGLLGDEAFADATQKNTDSINNITAQTNQLGNLVSVVGRGGELNKGTAMKGLLYKKAQKGFKIKKSTPPKVTSKKAELESNFELKSEVVNPSKKKLEVKPKRKFIPGPKGGF